MTPSETETIISIVELIGIFVTAAATVGLVYVTRILAVETRNLADRSERAHIVATIEPNQWTMMHVDIIVANTGNAVAYDISVAFDPVPATEKYQKGVPLRSLSVLKPGQQMSSFLTEWGKVEGKEFSVTITWRPAPNSTRLETNSYKFSMDQYQGIVQLGSSNPMIQIAEQVQKLREDWKQVASGWKKIEVNTHTSADRKKKDDETRAFYADAKAKRDETNAAAQTDTAVESTEPDIAVSVDLATSTEQSPVDSLEQVDEVRSPDEPDQS